MVRILAEVGSEEPPEDEQTRRVCVLVEAGPKALVEALRRLDAEDIEVHDVGLHRPTLDDVFLSLTGHMAEEPPAEGKKAGRRGRRARKGAAA